MAGEKPQLSEEELQVRAEIDQLRLSVAAKLAGHVSLDAEVAWAAFDVPSYTPELVNGEVDAKKVLLACRGNESLTKDSKSYYLGFRIVSNSRIETARSSSNLVEDVYFTRSSIPFRRLDIVDDVQNDVRATRQICRPMMFSASDGKLYSHQSVATPPAEDMVAHRIGQTDAELLSGFVSPEQLSTYREKGYWIGYLGDGFDRLADTRATIDLGRQILGQIADEDIKPHAFGTTA